MGFKLFNIGVVLTALASSCSAVKKNKTNDSFVKKDEFLRAYKTAFVCGCLNGGTKGNFNKFLLESNDLGLFSEGDLISHYKVNEADSIGREFSKRIKIFTYGDGKDKIPNFSRCMFFALGKEVDSLATESYKKTLSNDRQ